MTVPWRRPQRPARHSLRQREERAKTARITSIITPRGEEEEEKGKMRSLLENKASQNIFLCMILSIFQWVSFRWFDLPIDKCHLQTSSMIDWIPTSPREWPRHRWDVFLSKWFILCWLILTEWVGEDGVVWVQLVSLDILYFYLKLNLIVIERVV